MPKKLITLFIVLISVLMLACVSLPFGADSESDDSYDEEATEVTEAPVDESPVAVQAASPACLTSLDTMLNEEDDGSEESADLPELDDEYTLVTYQVSGNEISSPDFASDVPDELVSYQEDTATQQRLWKFVTDVIPADQREIISEFIIFSDGVSNTIGAVDEADTPGTWTLEIDIVDAGDLPVLATTMIHEFGHMVTLNDTQIGDASTCSTYESSDGCSKDDSYINAFYSSFWTDIYDEWSSTVLTSEDEEDEDQVIAFYDEYPDQFVTDYAPTNPEEDIAESWLYFVMGPKPAGNTVAEKKILFFYDYPELVDLRAQILSGLCQYALK
jgi:hypothetical protein